MAEEKKDWVFTFGVGTEHGGKFVEIHDTWLEARRKMFLVFGKEWAFQYPSREEVGVDKYGLKRLDLPDWSHLFDFDFIKKFLRLVPRVEDLDGW